MKYAFPENKKERLFDFYVLALLKDTINIKINSLLEETREILLKNQKQCFLNDLFYVICAEFRHLRTETTEGRNLRKLYACDEISAEEKSFLQNYLKTNYKPLDPFNKSQTYCKKHWSIQYNNVSLVDENDSNKEYYNSLRKTIKALKLTNLQPEDFVKLAEKCFDKLNWNGAYGGPMWADIATAWLQLNNTTNESQLILCIDHIYDLQHNTNTIFDKLMSYWDSSNGGYQWIHRSLNKKAEITHPYQLLNQTSLSMRIIARKILFANYKMTEEKYVNIVKVCKNSPKKLTDMLKYNLQ